MAFDRGQSLFVGDGDEKVQVDFVAGTLPCATRLCGVAASCADGRTEPDCDLRDHWNVIAGRESSIESLSSVMIDSTSKLP